MSLPVISLWQPFASLVFRNIKKHETRSRRIPDKHVGATVGIHATAKFPPLNKISEELHELCMETFGCNYNYSMPQGCILGTVRLGASARTEVALSHDNEDRICGDWRPNRWAWPLSEVTLFEKPIYINGHQGWWYYESRIGSDFYAEVRTKGDLRDFKTADFHLNREPS